MYKTLTIALVSAGALSAQAPEPPVVITIETENHVLYRDNTADMSRIADVQTPTSSVNIAFPGINVADIVALNSKASHPGDGSSGDFSVFRLNYFRSGFAGASLAGR